MGLAMLIPGVSGGTMILAMGLYTEFIDSIADVTAFRVSRRRLAFLAILGGFAAVSIIGLVRIIPYLLFHYDTAMYALFIGLALGGAPALLRSLRPASAGAAAATTAGVGLMIIIVAAKGQAAASQGTLVDVISGLVAAITMVLPGISGSYMLLIMGQYDRVVGSVRDWDFSIIVPVGIGAVAGVVFLSHALKYLLHRFQRPTIGFLLGMLLGSVIGLWPFGIKPSQQAMAGRDANELLRLAQRKGLHVDDGMKSEALIAHIEEHWRDRSKANDYAPFAVGSAVMVMVAGFGVTSTLSKGAPSLTGNPGPGPFTGPTGHGNPR